MRFPTIQGVIKRRILVNFCVEPKVLQKLLPAQFRPKLHQGRAIAGICLIRLEQMRPRFAPEFVGMASENAAHRFAVLWDEVETGNELEGVYIPRRDTGSLVNATLGGTLFPGEHHKARFDVQEIGDKIDFAMQSNDKTVSLELKGKIAESLPTASVFSSLTEASGFFEPGSLGYSVTRTAKTLDGIRLRTEKWEVNPFAVDFVRSSFYQNEKVFPKGSIEFDHALIMQNIRHEWHSIPGFELK